MKKQLLILILFCSSISFVSAQQQDQERKVKPSQETETSSISLEKLLKENKDQLIITAENISRTSGVRNIYLRQAINGLEIYGTESSIHYDKTGKLLVEHNRFLTDPNSTLKSSAQGLSARQAVLAVANKMGYKISDLKEINNLGGNNKAVVFNKANISSENIPARLMYYYKQGVGTQLVWELSIAEKTSSDWWNFRVNASTGDIIDKDNWTVSCNILGDHNDHVHNPSPQPESFVGPLEASEESSLEVTSNMAAPTAKYRVFAMPIETPNHGARTLVSNPENLLASPYGWHDTDGVEGAEYTYTRGNNAEAYDDSNNTNAPNGSHAESPGGNLIFDFPFNSTYSYSNRSIDAAITNLFYWSNIIHDVSYIYGFDEASGNFQQNNYGRGGTANDPVNAEAQDGSGTCNANFATGPDGIRPRMQMYICNSRDGDFDNSVIVHEYGHGISTRLTGGPAAAGCLFNGEQMGEGWSDFYGLMLTMKAGDTGQDSRGIGTWLVGQGANDPGIRNYPYSTNFSINPHTYNDIKTAFGEHDVGEVWATMLWEMTWEIMGSEPFDPDIYNGTGGNNIALALVTEGLKLQPCSPGFIDGRDAILAADQALYNGAYKCAIWEAFARRGLGYSADQGSSDSNTDGTEAFDLPPTFSGLNVIDEICLAGGIQTELSGGNPEGGVYSGIGVTDDGNGSTFTFDPSVAGAGMTTVTYAVIDFCSGEPITLTDTIEVTNNAPELVCAGTGSITLNGSETKNVGAPIPDGSASGLTSTIEITEDFSISDLNVNLDITHSWVGDIVVTIKSPSGTTATIVDRPGRTTYGYGCNGSDILATLDDQANSPIEDECSSSTPTIEGSFTPNNPLSIFNGQSTMGTWEIKVSDRSYSYTGTLNSWGIEYEHEIEAPALEVTLDENGNAVINAEELLFRASVDCGSYSVLAGTELASTVNFSCADVGTVNVPVEATNDNGAVSSCVAKVIVIDDIAPEITCPEDQIQDPGSDNTYIVPDYFASGEANAEDNCPADQIVTTQEPAAGTALSSGTHNITLTATDPSGNSATCTFELKVTGTVGTEDFDAIGSIKIFPNPIQDMLTITNPQNLPLETVNIFDLRGRLIKKVDVQNMGIEKTLDVSEMASSVYFVIIQGKDGQVTKKLVKE